MDCRYETLPGYFVNISSLLFYGGMSEYKKCISVMLQKFCNLGSLGFTFGIVWYHRRQPILIFKM